MAKVNISQWQFQLLSTPENIQLWEKEYNELKHNVQNNKGKYIKAVYGKYTKESCPYITFITLDALNKKDWLNNIQQNSCFVTYEINHITKKLSILKTGHVYISDIDKQTFPQFKYLACHSMLNIAKARKIKGIRQTTFKDINDLTNKILSSFNNIMDEVTQYTNGYPYHQGVNLITNN